MELLFLIFLNFENLPGPFDAEVLPVVNRNYLPVLLETISSAKKEILVFMYTVRHYPDYEEDIGKSIQDALIWAKRRGVEIEMILDASTWNKSNAIKNREFADTLIKEGIKVYYDPLEVTSHTKLIIVDREKVLLGSNNWSFYSLSGNNEAAVLIISPGVSAYFIKYFQMVKRLSSSVFPFKFTPRKPPKIKKKTSKLKSIHFSLPENFFKAKVYPAPNRDYVEAVHELIRKADKEISIAILSARYYADYRYDANSLLFQDLKDAANRGVHVKILLDASNYSLANDWENKKYGRLLKKNGIDVWYDSKEIATHCKLMVVDKKMVLIGSTNWSFHALELNNEASVLIESAELSRYFLEYIKKIGKNGERQREFKEWVW